MITSGAVTNRIDRLEQRGLVRRTKVAGDKRIVRIQLTNAGHALMERTVPDHLDNEAGILQPLTPTETRQLERLLRKVERGLSGSASNDR